MTGRKRTPAANSPSFFDTSETLRIVQAHFVEQRDIAFDELFVGYSRLKVLTYSNSFSIINRVAELIDDVEIIFGREDILSRMEQYLHFQELLLTELVQSVKGHDFVRDKIIREQLRLFVVQGLISHEKLYLLDGPSGTRVITGSANFSERAFSGTQNESYICFDNDAAAFDAFLERYERIKAQSTTRILPRAFVEPFTIEHLPAFAAGQSDEDTPKLIVVADRPPTPSIIQKTLSQKPPKQFSGLTSVLTTEQGAVRLDRNTARRAVQYMKANIRTETDNPEEYLSIDRANRLVQLSGTTLDLDPAPEAVAADIDILVSYFTGFEQFRGGDPQRLMRDYFTFMSWLYISPLICDIRNRALARDEYLLDYPVFGLLYGKSNCGKSELIRTLTLSMFGREGFLPNDWLTKSQVPGLRQQNRRYPLLFDDLDRTRFDNHAAALIKDDFVSLSEYPVTVLSMNGEKDTFETEIRKRCLIIYTGASLPDHTGTSRALATTIKKLKRSLGTNLYRAYLNRLLTLLHDDQPRDILACSSTILRELFGEYRQTVPDWCRVVSMDEYVQAKHDKVKDELIQLWHHKPDAWTVQGQKLVLRLDDVISIRKLKKDIPDYLIASGSQGDVIVFNRADLNAFLGSEIGHAPSAKRPWIARLFGRRPPTL